MYGVFFPQRNSTVCFVCVGVYSLADLVHSLKWVVRCVWTQLLVNSSMKLVCTNSFTWTTDCAFPRLLYCLFCLAFSTSQYSYQFYRTTQTIFYRTFCNLLVCSAIYQLCHFRCQSSFWSAVLGCNISNKE